jgi:serine/threonine protein kinase
MLAPKKFCFIIEKFILGDSFAFFLGTSMERPSLPDFLIVKEKFEDPLSQYYKAQQYSSQKEVFLRVLAPEKAKKYGKLFQEQGELQGRLKHPLILKLLDSWQSSEGYFLQSYQYCHLESISGRFKRTKKVFSEKEALKIALQLAEVLEYTESQKVVHCHLNPRNIFLTEKGILVHEFHFFEDPTFWFFGASSTLTPNYISPEQAQGTDPSQITIHSDLYAVGMVLFHMLAGRPAFQGSKLEIMSAHLKTEAPWAKEYNPELSEEVCFLLKQLTQKNPQERFETASDFRRAVEQTQQGTFSGLSSLKKGLKKKVHVPLPSSLRNRKRT